MTYPLTDIGDIANFVNGFAFKPEDWGLDGLPIIRIQNLTDPSKPYNFTTRKVPEKYLVNRGDVLVSWSATIDVFEWAGDSALLNQHIFKVEFDQSKIDKGYFKIALKKTIADLSRFAHGSTMKHVVKKDFEGHQIPLPSIEDQIRIAHLLGKVEALIAQRKQHLQQLDDLLKSVFLDMFGDPVRNEKGWEKKTAIDFAECIVPGRDKPKSFSGGTPWVTTGDLMHLGYTEKSRTGIGLSEYEIKEVRARVVPMSSVLMTCVGDLGVVSICNSDMVINQQLHAFQVSDEMSAEFFMYSLSFQKKYMYQNASQTTLPYMNKTVCNKTPMVCPPTDLQMKFSKLVQKVFHIKSKYHQILLDLEALYGSLSQQAFKGELDLSRVELSNALTQEVTS